jgi:hypothetical protein
MDHFAANLLGGGLMYGKEGVWHGALWHAGKTVLTMCKQGNGHATHTTACSAGQHLPRSNVPRTSW